SRFAAVEGVRDRASGPHRAPHGCAQCAQRHGRGGCGDRQPVQLKFRAAHRFPRPPPRDARREAEPGAMMSMPHANGMTRRTLLRCAALGTVALASGAKSRFGETVSSPPNIVFIMADDLGYADVSCYGRPDLRTPNIDRLAATGVRFLQAYANSAVCSATRTALITGRYQYRLPLGLEEPLTGRDVGLPPEHPTLPSLLRKAGYGTTLVGKWHLGAPPRFGPLQSGYDHFYGFRGGGVDYYTHAGLNPR